MEPQLLDRATYKKIKGMSREEMQILLRLISASYEMNLASLRVSVKSA